jgi:hypothetical protein
MPFSQFSVTTLQDGNGLKRSDLYVAWQRSGTGYRVGATCGSRVDCAPRSMRACQAGDYRLSGRTHLTRAQSVNCFDLTFDASPMTR